MAHQDYVARSRASKKNNPYKNKTAQPQVVSFKTKLVALITVLAIVFFAYFLWSIKDQQPPQSAAKKPVKIKKTLETSLPELPKEKWSYRKDLAGKSVEKSTYEVINKGPFKMQCGSFRTAHQAESVKAKMAFIGIESQVIKSQGKHNLWYKVILGPFVHKRSAESERHKLKKNNINGCQIWLWR